MSRRAWVGLWLVLHAVSRIAGALADAIEDRAWPKPEDDEDET